VSLVRSIARSVVSDMPSSVLGPAAGTTDLVMTVSIASDGDSFNLRGKSGPTYDCTVDWGDGSTSAISTVAAESEAALTHVYSTAGTYTIRVSGTFPRINMRQSTTRTALITVENLGVMGWDSNGLHRGFEQCNRMTSFVAGNTDTSAITTLFRTFRLCDRATSINLSGMDTSNVTSMESTFHDCNALTSLNLSGMSTANVGSFFSTFHDCRLLTSLDVSGFDTSSATGMATMFAECAALTSLNLSSFDTSGVFSFSGMFRSCTDLASVDLSSFDTSSALNMSDMFKFTDSLSSIDVSDFDTSNVQDFNGMFRGTAATDIRCDLFDITAATDLSNFLTSSTITTARYDAVLISWAGQTVTSGLTVSFGSSEFTGGGSAETARTSLINDDGWTISDGGAA